MKKSQRYPYKQVASVCCLAAIAWSTSSHACYNDNYGEACSMKGVSGPTFGDNYGATRENGEPQHHPWAGDETVWWSWSAPSDGWMTIDTFGSDFDTILAAYKGKNLGSLRQLAVNDDATGLQSQVAFKVEARRKYSIVVAGFDDVTGQIELNWQFVPVTATKHQQSHLPANTLDGVLGTRWSANGRGESIRYDLGGAKPLHGVSIAWHKGDQRRAFFDVEVSLDGETWVTAYSGSSSGTTTTLESYNLGGVSARFFRIVGYGNDAEAANGQGQNLWNSITEVEISHGNQSLVTASSYQYPNVPSRAFDHTVQTRWSAQGEGEWLQYTLDPTGLFNHVGSVDEVSISWYKGSQRQSIFDIDVSINGISWTAAYKGASNYSQSWETYHFWGVPAKHVRITGFGNSENNWNSINEMEYFIGGYNGD